MPRLCSISAARYRSFSRPATLELRPLTLLYGRNSAGKSALLRLLPLLADSVSTTAEAPIDLSGEVGNNVAFRDIVWKGPVDGHRDVELGLTWEGAPGIDEIRYTFRYSDDRRQILIEELALVGAATQALVLRRVPESRERERVRSPLLYEVTDQDGTRPPEPWTFKGLVPSAPRSLDAVNRAAALLTGLQGRIQWIKALRRPPQPERRIPDRGSGPALLRPDGSDACHALRADDDLRADVSSWYEEHAGRLVELRDAPPGDYRVLLRPVRSPGMDVDLVDAGEGFLQVFPVLTAAAMARRRARTEPFFLAIEEPESHLHPDRHVALARSFCTASASDRPPTIMVETHSSQILLTVQIEVATGNLPPDRVVIYWLEQLDDGSSVASRVTLDERGHPEGAWPPGVFADQRRLALELQRLQSGRPLGGSTRK